MSTKRHGQCCHLEAIDLRTTYCPECGTPLIRCRAYDECKMLLYRGEHCPSHVAPAVSIAPGAQIAVKQGGRVSLPLQVANNSNCGSTLRVDLLYKRILEGPVEKLDHEWSRLQAGEVKSLQIDSGILEHAGVAGVRLYLVVSAELGAYRETYAFSAHVPITVGEADSSNIHVEVGGDHDGTIYIGGQRQSSEWGKAKPRPALHLETTRAEPLETREGLRGYDNGTRVPRTTRVECRGFSEEDGMPECGPFLAKERLQLGRDRPTFKTRNDVSLRTYHADGRVNVEASGRVSGVHLQLYLKNDQLWLDPNEGRHGTLLNGERVEGVNLVRHGDRIRVPASVPNGPQFEVQFVTHDDMVDKIVLKRIPESTW